MQNNPDLDKTGSIETPIKYLIQCNPFTRRFLFAIYLLQCSMNYFAESIIHRIRDPGLMRLKCPISRTKTSLGFITGQSLDLNNSQRDWNHQNTAWQIDENRHIRVPKIEFVENRRSATRSWQKSSLNRYVPICLV